MVLFYSFQLISFYGICGLLLKGLLYNQLDA